MVWKNEAGWIEIAGRTQDWTEWGLEGRKKQNNYLDVVMETTAMFSPVEYNFGRFPPRSYRNARGYSNAESESSMNFTCYYTSPLLYYRTPAFELPVDSKMLPLIYVILYHSVSEIGMGPSSRELGKLLHSVT